MPIEDLQNYESVRIFCQEICTYLLHTHTHLSSLTVNLHPKKKNKR
jgi:hypothetical protein